MQEAEWVIDSLLSVRAPSVFSGHVYKHMWISVCKSRMCAYIHTCTIWPECVNCANSPGYRSSYSDLRIDSSRITEWDRRQLWCKWRQLFVYIMYTLDGWRGCIIPPIVLLAPFDMLPYNNEAVWCILCSGGLLHKGIVDRGHSDCLLTDQPPPPPPWCNLLSNICLYLCGIVILAGHGQSEKGRRERMHCVFENCGE